MSGGSKKEVFMGEGNLSHQQYCRLFGRKLKLLLVKRALFIFGEKRERY
jgi:hypothetical protein